MATNNVLGKVYETLLCSPGMKEAVKIDLKINRKTILLLSAIIESGFSATANGENEIIGLAPKECMQELQQFSIECLKKAGLDELSEKIKSIQQQK